jgi:hypothetical protein
MSLLRRLSLKGRTNRRGTHYWNSLLKEIKYGLRDPFHVLDRFNLDGISQEIPLDSDGKAIMHRLTELTSATIGRKPFQRILH